MKYMLGFLLIFVFFSCSDSESPVTEEDVTETGVIITEIMYNISSGEECQFIELKNISSENIDLSGFSIGGGISYTFKGDEKTLAPQEFIILTNSKSKFNDRYPDLEAFTEFSGSLSSKDDEIILYSSKGDTVTEVSYSSSAPWPIFANGKYRSLVPIDPNTIENQNDPTVWRASSVDGGSPMSDDPEQEVYNVIVNEYSPTSDVDGYIEFYNPADTAIAIGGWYLTTDKDTIDMFTLPTEAVIAANGYYVLKSSEASFSFVNGENKLILSAVEDGYATGYTSTLETYYTPEGTSFGVYTTPDGATSETTLLPSEGAINDDFKLGELVFSEIMYHPTDDGYEFLVLENRTKEDIVLSEISSSDVNVWKIKGIDYDFIENASIAASAKIVLFKGEISEISIFRSAMGIDSAVNIYTYSGKLANSDEMIEILKPEMVYVNSDGELKNKYSLSDCVHYYDDGLWPEEADGDGYHLVRKERDGYGNYYVNWEKSEEGDGKPVLD